jgi:hypothetical protein
MGITCLCMPKYWKSGLDGTGSESCPVADFAVPESSRYSTPAYADLVPGPL